MQSVIFLLIPISHSSSQFNPSLTASRIFLPCWWSCHVEQSQKPPEVKIYYVCPFLPAYKVCHSVRGGNGIGLTWFVGHKVMLVITHHSELFHVLANWLGILILWLMYFLSLFRAGDTPMQSWATVSMHLLSVLYSLKIRSSCYSGGLLDWMSILWHSMSVFHVW